MFKYKINQTKPITHTHINILIHTLLESTKKKYCRMCVPLIHATHSPSDQVEWVNFS